MRGQKRRFSQPSARKTKASAVGQVGIIFLLGADRLLIESSQLSEAEFCAGFANHKRGHDELWAQCQADGLVPRDEDYISVPRGRVIFSTEKHQYSLLLDHCILRKPKLIREIRQRMDLPSRGLVISTDGHYRCAMCMSRTSVE